MTFTFLIFNKSSVLLPYTTRLKISRCSERVGSGVTRGALRENEGEKQEDVSGTLGNNWEDKERLKVDTRGRFGKTIYRRLYMVEESLVKV